MLEGGGGEATHLPHWCDGQTLKAKGAQHILKEGRWSQCGEMS
jgi:hypothetical protein